jgi:hypothetical protein
MGTAREPKPCKYFIALLCSDADALAGVEDELAPLLGPIDGRSDILTWTGSRYYEPEMGSRLSRRFVSFAPLASPGDLARIKLCSQTIEDRRRRPSPGSGRTVNIDPGYVESGKVVLASTKNASHRVYLSGGIYGEATLLYHAGAFHGCPHTYPDYLWPETLAFFQWMRQLYLRQLRGTSRNGTAEPI